jgi:hypothetical protein
VGIWWLFNERPADKAKLALVEKPADKTTLSAPEKAIPGNKPVLTALKPKPNAVRLQNPIGEREIAVNPNFNNIIVSADKVAEANIKDSVPKDTTPLNELIVMGYTAQKKKDITESATTVAKPDSGTSKLLQGKVAGVAIRGAASPKNYKSLSKKLIKGRVIGKDDGLPVVGASVRMAGTNIGAVTDVNGRFALPADSNKTKLVIASIGYNTLQLNTRNHDSLKTIALEPTNNSLNEVVVVGYGTSKKNDGVSIIDAHPQEGWSSFRIYLKENAISPDGKTGVVRLSFVVDHNGIISDMKVLKGLSPATDQKAIDLINDGPDWIDSTSEKSEKVNLRVKFVNLK